MRQVALGDVCDIVAGGTPSRSRSEYFNGAIPWVKIGDMLQGRITTTEEAVSAEGLANSSAKLLPRGTVLISIFATIGRTAVLDIDAATNQAIAGVLPKPGTQIDRAYLRHCLDSIAAALLAQASGVAQININSSKLRAQPIPLPPLSEQLRIAEVLDRAETLRAQRRQALAQLDALAESIFLSLLTDPASAPWAHPTIGEIATTMRTGPFGSQLLHGEFVESGVAVLGIDNVVQNKFVWARPRYITESKFSQLERYRVAAGDVLITIMGTCGRCAIVPDDVPVAINTKHLCCIRLDQSRCIPMYLQATLLRHPEVLYRLGVHERGAVMPGLNMQLIRDLEIPLPPLAVQRRFDAEMRSVSDQQQTMTESLEQLDALFASLQHRAFRGEL